MTEMILELIERRSDKGYGKYKTYDARTRGWIHRGGGNRVLESIIEREFDVHEGHVLIRTSEQLIIIEARYCAFELYDGGLRDWNNFNMIYGTYLVDVVVVMQESDSRGFSIGVAVEIITDSFSLIANIDSIGYAEKNYRIIIESNQLNTRFYV